jgi:hypothetical protein
MNKELSLGMAVRVQDGKAGHLQKIVADPKTHEPAYLVVRRGRLSPRDIVVPVGLVTELDADTLMLDTTQEALNSFPDYEVAVEMYRQPNIDYAARWPLAAPLERARTGISGKFTVRERTVPEHTVVVERGMVVYDCAGAKLGEIERVLMDPDAQQAAYLVLRQGLPLKAEHRLVPVDLVDFVIRSDVYLFIEEAYVQGLPIYQPGKSEVD